MSCFDSWAIIFSPILYHGMNFSLLNFYVHRLGTLPLEAVLLLLLTTVNVCAVAWDNKLRHNEIPLGVAALLLKVKGNLLVYCIVLFFKNLCWYIVFLFYRGNRFQQLETRKLPPSMLSSFSLHYPAVDIQRWGPGQLAVGIAGGG